MHAMVLNKIGAPLDYTVANLTRRDGIDFLRLASEMGVVTMTSSYPLARANEALADLRAGRFEGAAVLVP